MLLASGTLTTPRLRAPEPLTSPWAWLQSRPRAGGHLTLCWHLLPTLSITYSPVTVPVTSFQTSLQERRREGTQPWAARLNLARLGPAFLLRRQAGPSVGRWPAGPLAGLPRPGNDVDDEQYWGQTLGTPSCK